MRNNDYMQRALSLAKLALGHSAPNPAVGAVIVKDDVIVGRATAGDYSLFNKIANRHFRMWRTL